MSNSVIDKAFLGSTPFTKMYIHIYIYVYIASCFVSLSIYIYICIYVQLFRLQRFIYSCFVSEAHRLRRYIYIYIMIIIIMRAFLGSTSFTKKKVLVVYVPIIYVLPKIDRQIDLYIYIYIYIHIFVNDVLPSILIYSERQILH